MGLALALILIIAVPLAWLASEFQQRVWLRVLLGSLAIAMSFAVAWLAGSLERLNSNAWYGFASKKLIESTLAELEQGDTSRLAAELKRLNEQFQPTYENRARYDQLVDEFAARLGKREALNP